MKVGFIGLGNMGSDIAINLNGPGIALTVFDTAAAATAAFRECGAKVANTPADVARDADIVGICVRDDKEVHEVMEGPNGILASARPGLLVAVHSTVRVETMRSLAETAAKKGVGVLDVPVTRTHGTPAHRAIVFMVGGATEDVARIRPYVDLCAMKVIEAGPLGAAMALKIINNTILYLTFVTAEDMMNLADAVGLDYQYIAQVTSLNGNASPNLLKAFERRTSGASGTAFALPDLDRMGTISEKDLDCTIDVARNLGVEVPAAVMARQHIRRAFAGWFKNR